MHQSFDEPLPRELPWRDARGRLRDRDGGVLADTVCEECKRPESSAYLKLFQGKWRCTGCMHFWIEESKPKPGIRAALLRARREGLPATLTEEQWQETLEHFKHVCAYCGTHSWRCVEHATPLPLGGTTVDNCVPACPMCNVLKRGKTLEEMAVEGFPGGWMPAKRWQPALDWLLSKGRPVVTADQWRRQLAARRVDPYAKIEGTYVFQARTVLAMEALMKALIESGHRAELLGRKRKIARIWAQPKVVRETAERLNIRIDHWLPELIAPPRGLTDDSP